MWRAIAILSVMGGYMVALSATWQSTPQSQLFVEALQDALAALRIRPKEAAHIQDLSESEWSKQCANEQRRHVSLQRITRLPPAVIRMWLKQIAPAYGLRCFDRNDDIVALIDGVQQAVSSFNNSNERKTA